MKCSQCQRGLPADDVASYCPYCGTPVQGLTSLAKGGTSLSCPGCGTENLANAKFCKNCGRQLPHGWSDAAAAAAKATSSAGRQAQDLRTRQLRAIDQRAAERAALAVPSPSGRGLLADLGAAEDHFARVETGWQQLDARLRSAEAEAGQFPSAADLAEIADLRRRTDAAWASRQAAKEHRDRLQRQEDGW